MINILLLNKHILQSKVIEIDTEEFFNNLNLQYKFIEKQDPNSAFDIVSSELPVLAFVDISGEDFDGIEFIKKIKNSNISTVNIIAVTTLYDTKFRYEALKLGIYHFIYKPFDYKEIKKVLEKIFHNNNLLEQEQEQEQLDDFEDFEDFDDDFFDFDDDQFDLDTNAMDDLNKSHQKLSATEFLSSYSEDDFNNDKYDDLQDNIDSIVANLLFEDEKNCSVDEVIEFLEQYRSFLYSFSEFDKLNNIITQMIDMFKEKDFDTLENKNIISKFVVSILQDLVEWKEHVFDTKDAVDVFYINASVYNSFVQLKDIYK